MDKLARLNQTDDLKKFLTSTKRQKINPLKKNKKKEEDQELSRLMVDELFEIQKLKVVVNVTNDRKKLEKLLLDLCKTVNALTKCCAQQTRLTATELLARPTYVEELNNIRDNVNKAILPKEYAAGLTQEKVAAEFLEDDEDKEFDANYDNISHLSKLSLRRKESNTKTAVGVKQLGLPTQQSPAALTPPCNISLNLEQVQEEEGSEPSQVGDLTTALPAKVTFKAPYIATTNAHQRLKRFSEDVCQDQLFAPTDKTISAHASGSIRPGPNRKMQSMRQILKTGNSSL